MIHAFNESTRTLGSLLGFNSLDLKTCPISSVTTVHHPITVERCVVGSSKIALMDILILKMERLMHTTAIMDIL